MGLEWQKIISSLNLTIVANWINFAILVAVLSWLLFRPAKEFIQEKRERIKSRIDSAQEREKTAEELKAQRQQELKEARERRQEIIGEAEERADKIVEEAREEAEEQASRIVDRAKKEAEQERREALKELKEQYVGLSMVGAERVLQREIDREDHEKFLDSLFEDIQDRELDLE
ncbi:F0F1 ATP synthase subunit B [Candidatus Bipolaricaulota bacterium]|nr:F0F1 ATP synthase subunit B [Candidatus Bipolaricaulota bacterium]